MTAPVTFCTMHMAPLLGEMGRRYPKLQLDLHLSDTVSNLVDEGIDVAIRIGSAEEQPNLIARRLSGHQRVICASPDYLRRHGTPAVPPDLLAHNCLLFSYGGTRRGWRLREHGRDDGGCLDLPVRGTLSINNAEVLRRAALDGLGVAMLADWLVGPDVKAGTLVPLLTAYQANPGPMEIGLYAMYSASRRGSLTIKAFVDLLQEGLARQLPDSHAG